MRILMPSYWFYHYNGGFAGSLSLLIMQVREFLPLILLPLIVNRILYAVFKTGLHIPLPAGFLGFREGKRCNISLKDFR